MEKLVVVNKRVLGYHGRKPDAEFGGTEKNFADQDDDFFLKNVHFSAKNF